MQKYENRPPTPMHVSWKSMLNTIRDSLKGRANRRPDLALPVTALKEVGAAAPGDIPRVTWFGHSAVLLELEGKRLLFDPMFGNRPSPVSWAGPKRYSLNHPLQPEDLPAIDAIILSHNHYDHLDYFSICKLMDRTHQFIVPMGVGKRLIKWGIPFEHIIEHAWWDEFELGGLAISCTPSRHFSGRGLFDRNSTLWCSWVIVGSETKVFFSGDSGYGPHFKDIGERYGPFNLTLMECGQYDERWSAIHMLPEETVQAHLDLLGQLLIPIHWGAFTLSFHAWTDPVERVTQAALKRGVRIATPRIGESFEIYSEEVPTNKWWR